MTEDKDGCLFLNPSVFLISKEKYDAHGAALAQLIELAMPTQQQTIMICRLKEPLQQQSDMYPVIPSVSELQNIHETQPKCQTLESGFVIYQQKNAHKSLVIGVNGQLFSADEVRAMHQLMVDEVYKNEMPEILAFESKMNMTLDDAIKKGLFGIRLDELCDLQNVLVLAAVYHRVLSTCDNVDWNQDFIIQNKAWSVLQAQAVQDHTEVCTWLIAHGQNLHFRETQQGYTVLAGAAISGSENTVKMLLACGADPLAVSNDKKTALHLAAALNRASVIEVLCMEQYGVSLNAISDNNIPTPLLLAVNHKSLNAVEKLLQCALNRLDGQQVIREMLASTTRTFGWTALHLASSLGAADIVKLLLKYKAFFSADMEVPSAAMEASNILSKPSVPTFFRPQQAVQHPMALAAGNGHTECIRVMLDHGIDINACNPKDKQTALHSAILGKHWETVEFLLANGADPAIPTNLGATGLILAAEQEGPHCLEMIFKYNDELKRPPIDVNAEILSRSPVRKAALKGRLENLIFLVEHKGGSMFNLGYASDSLLQVAAEGGHLDVVEWVWRKIQRLPNVNLKEHLNYQNKRGWTALYCAAFHGHQPTIDFLLELGADPFLDSKDGWTFIMLLARDGDNTRLQGVLNRIPNTELRAQRINSGTLEKWTAIHSAASLGHVSTVEILMDNGGDILQQNAGSWTPLACAVLQGQVDVAKVILEKLRKNNTLQNARKVHDDLNISLLHLAAASKNCQDPEMIMVLLENGFDAAPRAQFALPEKPPTTPASLLIRPSPAELAVESGKSQAFVKASFLFNDLQLIANSEKVKEWLTKNPSLATAVNHRGENALHIAFRNGHLQTAEVVMEELIKQSKLIEALASNGYDKNVGMTPLHEAIESVVAQEAIEMVIDTLLLHYSDKLELIADPFNRVLPKQLTAFDLLKCVDQRERTLLALAELRNKSEVVALLQNVQNPTATNSDVAPLQMRTGRR